VSTAGRLLRSAAKANDYFNGVYKVEKRTTTVVSIYSPASGTVAKGYDYTSSADIDVSGSAGGGMTGFDQAFTVDDEHLVGFQWVSSAEL
jgi:hypothetical protein